MAPSSTQKLLPIDHLVSCSEMQAPGSVGQKTKMNSCHCSTKLEKLKKEIGNRIIKRSSFIISSHGFEGLRIKPLIIVVREQEDGLHL